jgi:hypothetical protein
MNLLVLKKYSEANTVIIRLVQHAISLEDGERLHAPKNTFTVVEDKFPY